MFLSATRFRPVRPWPSRAVAQVAFVAFVALAAVLATAVAADPLRPPRPQIEERLRLIQSHPRLPIRFDPVPQPDAGQDEFDVANYDLTIAPSVWEARIQGTVAITFTTAPGVPEVRELILDLAANMTIPVAGVTRRRIPGSVPFTREGDVLRIDLAARGGSVATGTSDTVTIRYSGYPAQDEGSGLQFSIFGRFPNHVPSMYSLSQPYFARTWWPCKDRPDDKATVTVRIDAPAQWEAISNGTHAGQTSSSRDGNVITAWRERVPIPTYLVAVALSDYETCEAEYVSPLDASIVTPVISWAWPSRIDDACEQWAPTVPIMTELARRFGEYPFASEKYSHVAISPLARTNPYIAMENATCSFIGSGWLGLRHETLIAHELAHHWWGNSVTPRDFRSLWLNEGFATYGEALWWESQNGHAEYLGYMRDLDTLRSSGEFVGPVDQPIDADENGWPDGDASGPELTVYYKGAWVLHMLRWVLGQADQGLTHAPMDRLLTAWGAEHQRGIASTSDFVTFADTMATDELGQRDGLRWFFEQWLDRDDRPCYEVGWTAPPAAGGGFTLQLAVKQAKWGRDEDLGVDTCAGELDEPYRMPVQVLVELDGGARQRFTVDNRSREQSFLMRLPARPISVTWDPDGWILKAVEAVDADMDDDGWADPFDSCPLVPDPEQRDENGNGLGDACEPGMDFDRDGSLNEVDCAPADAGAWTATGDLPPIDMAVGKSPNGLAIWHDMPARLPGDERVHVMDIAQGRLERLRANGSFRDAACVEEGRVAGGELVIPWSSLPGNHYIVLLPFNGCGLVDATGVLDDPCR